MNDELKSSYYLIEYSGHVARVEDMKNEYKFFFGNQMEKIRWKS